MIVDIRMYIYLSPQTYCNSITCNILRYIIAYAILLTCENACDIDIAYSNI